MTLPDQLPGVISRRQGNVYQVCAWAVQRRVENGKRVDWGPRPINPSVLLQPGSTSPDCPTPSKRRADAA